MPPSYLPLRWESTGDQWWYASPIDWAAANGHYDLVRQLIKLDGNNLIKLTSLRRIRRLETVWDDEEQFHDVAMCRSLVARELFSECETKTGKNSLIRSGYGGWLLYTATSAGDLKFVQDILKTDPLLVFGEGEYGVTDMLYAGARSKNRQVFMAIYDFSASPRFQNDSEKTEIPRAYTWEMMNRAVHAAARGGNLEVLVEIIKGCECDVLGFRDLQGSTILHAAASRGQVEVVKHLISSFDIINSKDNNGNTALHVAAHRGHLSVVESLITSSPPSIHEKNNLGETFLHMVMSGFQNPTFHRLDRQIELTKKLVQKKLKEIEKIINEKDNNGRTALHVAIIGNVHLDIVEFLMTVGSINVNIRDKNYMTPLDLLKQGPRSADSDILTKHLILAGGIFSCQDYSARKSIASHLRMRSIGSPGTSFTISDSEIFLHTSIEDSLNKNSTGSLEIGGRLRISDFSRPNNVTVETHHSSNSKNKKPRLVQKIKHALHWPKAKEKTKEKVAKTETPIPIPLRERFLKRETLPTHKRTLSERSNSNLPSPTPNKYHSRSSSFSIVSSISSPIADIDKQKRGYIETDIAGPSSEYKTPNLKRKRGSMYLCFGGMNPFVKDPIRQVEINKEYKDYALSVA